MLGSKIKDDVLLVNIPPATYASSKASFTSSAYVFPPIGLCYLGGKLLKSSKIRKVKCLDYALVNFMSAITQDEEKKVISNSLLDFLAENELKPKFVCVFL